ncbi:MAG: HlyD family efflux transporter periplasmic adaptor subunit [Deltaproteobacteria bacterium]|nr:MAG: HlyD family efflux transporter periplasmic adaptor subunit [Deltaproteobacteria bacterium]
MDISLRRKIGIGLWVVGLAIAGIYAFRDQARVEGPGLGFAPTVQLSVTEAARLDQVVTPLHTAVQAGEVVARLDAAPLREERAVVHARLLAAQEQMRLDADNDIRRLAEGFNRALSERVDVQVQLGADLAEADALRELIAIERALFQKGAASEQAVADWDRQLRVVEARIREGRKALDQLRQAELLATERIETRHEPELWSSVLIESRELDRLDAMISRTELRAAIDGQVTWVHYQPGEVVIPGEPVVSVAPFSTQEVVGWLHQDKVRGLQPGSNAQVIRTNGERIPGKLVSVGSGPRTMPEQLWYNPQRPEVAVPVKIALQGAVAPNESVSVRL